MDSGNQLALGVIGRTSVAVTIEADKSSAVFKGDDITYTLTRSGLTTDVLPVTVALTQTGDFLAVGDLTKTVTIDAGQSAKSFTIMAASFQHFAQGATVEGGTLTAAVLAGTGYVLGTPASVDVSIVVALTIGLEMASYSIAEEVGSLEVKLVARTGAGAASSSGSSSSPPRATTPRPPTSRPTTTSSGIAPRPATPTFRPTPPRSMSLSAPPTPMPVTIPAPPSPIPTRASPSTGSTEPRLPTTTRISTTAPGTTRSTTRTKTAPTVPIPL